MKEIELTKGYRAIIDDDMFEIISQYKWHWTHGYARSSSVKPKLYMHTLILGKNKDFVIDHINRNGIDNRRINLRFVDKSTNAHNSGPHKNSRSKIRGVYKSRNGWEASLKIGYKNVFRKWFKEKNDAIQARIEAVKTHIKYSPLHPLQPSSHF